jgi:hypothetical protein
MVVVIDGMGGGIGAELVDKLQKKSFIFHIFDI